jgi:hypothetical protein
MAATRLLRFHHQRELSSSLKRDGVTARGSVTGQRSLVNLGGLLRSIVRVSNHLVTLRHETQRRSCGNWLLDYSGAARTTTSIARCRCARKSAEDDAQFTRDAVVRGVGDAAAVGRGEDVGEGRVAARRAGRRAPCAVRRRSSSTRPARWLFALPVMRARTRFVPIWRFPNGYAKFPMCIRQMHARVRRMRGRVWRA